MRIAQLACGTLAVVMMVLGLAPGVSADGPSVAPPVAAGSKPATRAGSASSGSTAASSVGNPTRSPGGPAVAPSAAEAPVADAAASTVPVPACAECEEPGRDPRSVFFVQRNKNRNEVHYGIRLDAECRPVGDDPVYNYWLRLKNGPNVTEAVSFFQQAGYGLQRQTVAPEHVDVVMRALPKRPIRIVSTPRRDGCRVIAYMQIAGAERRFERAYVFAEDGLVLPKVRYIDLFGRAADGREVHEHLSFD